LWRESRGARGWSECREGRECGLATALIGTPYGIGVGVVGIGLAQNEEDRLPGRRREGRWRCWSRRRREARTRTCLQSPRRRGNRRAWKRPCLRGSRPGRKPSPRRALTPGKSRRRRRQHGEAGAAGVARSAPAGGPDCGDRKIAMGASTASSQRQGYCRKGISGSRCQSGREMGKRRNRPRREWRPAEPTRDGRRRIWRGERAATPTDRDAATGDGDHGDGNPRNLTQDLVVQREQRIGVVREEPVVLEVVAGIFGGLFDVDPIALECRGEPVDGGEAETQHWRLRREERGPGFVDQSPESATPAMR
jgi:hypothetical protein